MKADQALPALEWLRGYNRERLINDGLAAVIVTIMLIPQSLAYALLAGLPAEMGLYASILPLIAYALFGSSRTLSVGPVLGYRGYDVGAEIASELYGTPQARPFPSLPEDEQRANKQPMSAGRVAAVLAAGVAIGVLGSLRGQRRGPAPKVAQKPREWVRRR